MESKFYDTLNGIYKKEKELSSGEYENACKIIEKIENSLNGRYEIIQPINMGGTGIVIKIRDCNLKINRALKLPRPKKGREDYFNSIISSEIIRLCEVTHQNIISIYYAAEVEHEDNSYPYYVMEYVEGAVDGFEYINNKEKPRYNDLISFLYQWVLGLSKLHEKGFIHGDVKLENTLVSQTDLLVKVSDLGSARLLSNDDEVTDMIFTIHHAHPELNRLVRDKGYSDPNRAMIKTIARSQIKIAYDLFSLGKNIFRILEVKEYKDSILITEYQRNYLTLLAARLLDGENDPHETYLTIPQKGMKQIKYNTIQEVLIDLKKASGEYSINEIVPELNSHSHKTIQASSDGINTFTDRVSRLLNTKLVSRLANISQLGLMVYVYPTAVHTRLEHVLGTMLNVARFIDALWHDPINPFFKQVITDKDIKKLLVAALLHDIGQYALAHDLEEADPQLFSHSDNNERLLSDKSISSSLEKILKEDWDLSIDDIRPVLGIHSDNKTYKDVLLNSIIDGPIDADKLDYLIRDANNLNIPYGKAIDYSKIIRSLTVVFKRELAELIPILGIHEKGKIAAEGVAFARYAMFGAVYWHHTIRSIKAMLHRAVWEALPDLSDRRTKDYRMIQDEIFKEVYDQLLGKDQPWLFEFNSENLKFTGNINSYDFKIISFFYEKTSDAGKQLLKMICERRIYKRLFVFSTKKSDDIYRDIFKMREGDWRHWVSFQKEFEDLLIKEIRDLKKDERTISVLSEEHTNKIDLLAGTKIPLFLIDIPIPRSGSKDPLQYLHEVRFTSTIQYNTEEMISPEDSVIWYSITDDLSKSIGKARVFCHPDIIDTASVFFKRDKIEKAVYTALRKTK